MQIEFLPEAKYELDDAVDFYELQVKGLGGTFQKYRQINYKKSSYFSNSMD